MVIDDRNDYYYYLKLIKNVFKVIAQLYNFNIFKFSKSFTLFHIINHNIHNIYLSIDINTTKYLNITLLTS